MLPIQTHTIVDGDTLPKLASAIWEADRYRRNLRMYNRDVLKRSGRVADRRRTSYSAKIYAADGRQRGRSKRIANDAKYCGRKMLHRKLRRCNVIGATAGAGKADSAFSASANQKPAPRTYTVQAGENLLDIAKKVYGDGRRYQDLFEANRRLLRTPADVKPGMVLAMP